MKQKPLTDSLVMTLMGVFTLIVILFGVFWFGNQNTEEDTDFTTTNELENKIRSNENNVPILSEEEIYQNPFVKHIRIALNGYLDGSNNGIEGEFVINGLDGMPECSLSNFKPYYKSKFIIWTSQPSKYGGILTDLIFVDNPDSIFEAWVYKYGDGGEYVLRSFCKRGPKEELREKFPSMIKEMIEAGKFPYSL